MNDEVPVITLVHSLSTCESILFLTQHRLCFLHIITCITQGWTDTLCTARALSEVDSAHEAYVSPSLANITAISVCCSV